MRPEAPSELLAAVACWQDLSAPERADLGRALRRLGWTYCEIRSVLPVPQSTLAGWCRGVELSADQVAAIRERSAVRRRRPRDTQRGRRAEVARIREQARGFARTHLHDPLFVAGTVLYWGEGAKTKRMLALSNADPAALRLFIRWVRGFHDPRAEFVLSLHLHRGDDDARARAWWLGELRVDDDFTKTYIKPAGTGHRSKVLPHGVCRVRVRRAADAWCRTDEWIRVVATELASDRRGESW